MNSWWRWALHAAPDDLALEHVEGGEQGGRAMPLVVVGHGAKTALFHRQAGLGAVERLDLRLCRRPRARGRGLANDIPIDEFERSL